MLFILVIKCLHLSLSKQIMQTLSEQSVSARK